MSHGGRIEAFVRVPSGQSISVNTGAGAVVVNLTASSYTLTSLLAHLLAALTAQAPPSSGAWAVSVSTGAAGTGQVTIAVTVGTYSLTWTSTALRDLLGFTANVPSSATATGTKQAKGLWLPKTPLLIDGHPSSAPKVTNLRATEGPRGNVTTLGGSSKRVHRNLRWEHVPTERIYEAEAPLDNASWEQFLEDTQFGDGHTWFRVGSAFQVYREAGGVDELVGSHLNAGAGPSSGWKASPAIREFAPARAVDTFLGYFTVEIPRVVAAG